MTEHKHESHPEIVKRLKRAEGHLKSVIAMIASGSRALTSPSSSMLLKRRSLKRNGHSSRTTSTIASKKQSALSPATDANR